MTRYRVKEIFGPTLQGEGAHAGRACVFLRFAACNLACSWCDTDFAIEGSTFLTAEEIVGELLAVDTGGSRMVVVTGGEPSLQWNAPLATAIRAAGFRAHMETNGTTPLAAPVDWLTVSPKPRFHPATLELTSEIRPDECKVVVDDTIDEAALEAFERRYADASWFLQPCAGDTDDESAASLSRTLELIRARPRWRLSLQIHKIINVP